MTATDHRVLVVDDNRMNRIKMTRALKDAYQVTQVQGGQEALDLLLAQPIDLVLLDIMMPGMDGFEVLRRMKDEASLRDIPVIVVSGLEDTESVNRCLEMGAVDFISKPFDLVQIKTCVDRSLPDRGSLHE